AAPARCSADQMPHRVDLAFGPESVGETAHVVVKHQKRIADALLTRLIPVRQLKLADVFLADLDGVLKSMHLLEVLWIIGIDQCPNTGDDVARADILPRQHMPARSVVNRRHIVIVTGPASRSNTPEE